MNHSVTCPRYLRNFISPPIHQICELDLVAVDEFLFFFSVEFLLIDPGSVSGIHIFQIPVTCPLFDAGMYPAYCCGW